MVTTQLTDVIIPGEFTAYQVENSLVSTALSQSGVVANNAMIADQLQAGAESFTVPFWADLSDVEADITNDDPTILSTPQTISAHKQTVRKSYLRASWSQMSLASELSGDGSLACSQDRVTAYRNRQVEKRVIIRCWACSLPTSPTTQVTRLFKLLVVRRLHDRADRPVLLVMARFHRVQTGHTALAVSYRLS